MKQQVSGLTVPALPAGISGDDLILALNQRFRQLSLASVAIPAASGSSGVSAGSGGSGYYTITPAGSSINIDLAKGFKQRLVLVGTTLYTFGVVTYAGGTISAALDPFLLYLDNDSGTGGHVAPTLLNVPGAFVAGAIEDINGGANLRTVIQFSFHGIFWGPDFQKTGIATS